MSEVSRILDQFRRARDGDAWHGPPLFSILADVSAETAAARPAPGVHSIAEIVLHLAAWHEAGSRRLQGQEYEPPLGENWPQVATLTEPAWQNCLFELRRSFEELCVGVAEFPDSRLEEQVAGKNYSFYVLLHGVVQHDQYHAGQIALLKKLAPSPDAIVPSAKPLFTALEASACTRLLEAAL